jgi:serine/threonine protein kinase
MYTKSDSRNIRLLKRIDGGKEGEIWTVDRGVDVIAKIYNTPTREHETKLQAMIRKPPRQPSTHTAVSWPLDIIRNNRQMAGFLMPYAKNCKAIIAYYNPTLRIRGFNLRYLLRTSINLCIAIDATHLCGHIIGDINESNILVNDNALVTLVDTDSFQIVDQNGKVFHCPVGKPEYTPPELHGMKHFASIQRSKEHDLFGMAILIFQLLMEGRHPFAGVIAPSAQSVGRVDLYCIKQGLFPYKPNSSVKPPPSAPSFENLHAGIQKAFITCFHDGHRNPAKRPSAKAWRNTLESAEKALIPCSTNPEHYYWNHLKTCPYCLLGPSKQRPLPSASGATNQPRTRPVKPVSAQPQTPQSLKNRQAPPVHALKYPAKPGKKKAKIDPIFWVVWALIYGFGWGISLLIFNVIENDTIKWLIFGGINGFLQCLYLSRYLKKIYGWIVAVIVTWIFFRSTSSWAYDHITGLLEMIQTNMIQVPFTKYRMLSASAILWLIYGGFCGLFQWVVIRKKLKPSVVWIPANAIGCGVGSIVASVFNSTINHWLNTFLGSRIAPNTVITYWIVFALIFGLVTGLIMTWLLRNVTP